MIKCQLAVEAAVKKAAKSNGSKKRKINTID